MRSAGMAAASRWSIRRRHRRRRWRRFIAAACAACASISTARSRRRAATRSKRPSPRPPPPRGMMSWHVQVIAPLPVLLPMPICWRSSPVPVVIDHYGALRRPAPGQRRGPPPARSGAPAACLDETVRALPSRPRSAEHPARPRMARGTHRGCAGPLRLGQRLAASAGARRSRRARRSKRRIARCPTRRWSTIFSPRCRPPISPSGS